MLYVTERPRYDVNMVPVAALTGSAHCLPPHLPPPAPVVSPLDQTPSPAQLTGQAGVGLPWAVGGIVSGPSTVRLPVASGAGWRRHLSTLPPGRWRRHCENHVLWFLKCLQYHPASVSW